MPIMQEGPIRPAGKLGPVHAGMSAGFVFSGSSALSIARLAAASAAALLAEVPDFVPVSVSIDHFQKPRLMPWMIRYSTPRCSMLSLSSTPQTYPHMI